MPVTPERISRLREFGLSEYAARAYLALLELGLAEAREVSQVSRVPQAKVYQVLDQLHEKGLAVIMPEFPKKYAPVPFEEFLDRIHRQHLEAAESIDRSREELASVFSVTGKASGDASGVFAVLRGRDAVFERVTAIGQSGARDVLVVATADLLERPGRLAEACTAAVRSGARVRVLVPKGTAPLGPGVDTRVRSPGGDDVALMVCDLSLGMLVTGTGDPSSSEAQERAILLEDAAIVAFLRASAEALWSVAAPVATPRSVPVRTEAELEDDADAR